MRQSLSGPSYRDGSGLSFSLSLLLLILGADLTAAPSVRVAWDPNPETNIQGYRIYYGPTGGSTNLVDVGNLTTGAVTNLAYATSYFFYVTAYNTFGLESDPSETLTYTTPAFSPLSLSMEPHLIVLAPSVVTLRPGLTGDRQPGTALTFSWQQLGGPEWLTVAGLTTLTPTLQVRTPGLYNLQLTVTEGASILQKTTALQALNSTPPSAGLEPISLAYIHVPTDGLLLSWNSEPGATYLVGRQPDLNDRLWVLEAMSITSAGDTTDFVIGQDRLDQIKSGFFAVFRTP